MGGDADRHRQAGPDRARRGDVDVVDKVEEFVRVDAMVLHQARQGRAMFMKMRLLDPPGLGGVLRRWLLLAAPVALLTLAVATLLPSPWSGARPSPGRLFAQSDQRLSLISRRKRAAVGRGQTENDADGREHEQLAAPARLMSKRTPVAWNRSASGSR